MAGYTSRIFLTLTLPSVFGFLSVLWFLKRKGSSTKQISKGVQVEDSSASEDTPNRFLALNPMKLKNQEEEPGEGNVSCSEMQLKETQTSQSQNSNGIQQNGKVKAKKSGSKSKLRENSPTCPRESLTNGKDKHHSAEDNEIELSNGIEALNLDKDVSAKDAIFLRAIDETCGDMEIRNGTNSLPSGAYSNGNVQDVVIPETDSKRSVQEVVGSSKEPCDTDTTLVSSDRNFAEKESKIELPPKVQTDATAPLTLPVGCPESSGDMLESPGAKYCDSVGSNDSGKGGSEFQFLLETQQVYMVYEFEIVQELCGLLIGRNGRHVNYIKQETNANILIKRHPYYPPKKVCSVTGTEDEIHAALKLIRKRFPVEMYPTVTLSQINSLPYDLQLPEVLKLCLPEGVSFEAMLCATVNAGHFFLQQPTHPTFHSLPALTTQMTALYNQLDAPKLTHLAKSYVCAASLTDGWFRAEVDEVFEDSDECRLKFLDYGGYTVVQRAALRQIKYEFMHVPFQATECYLGSITFPEGDSDWSSDATAAFEELAQGQIVQGYIVGYAENRVPYVHLHKITGATSVFINRELVSRGLARWNSTLH